MQPPKVGPEHERLALLVGEWEGEEQQLPSPWGPGGPARGHNVFRRDLDGFAVIQDYQHWKDGRVGFLGHGVFTIDPPSGDVLWWWFDSMGFPPAGPARGRWQSDSLTLTRTTPRGESLYVIELAGKNEYRYRMESRTDPDPTLQLFMTASFRRK